MFGYKHVESTHMLKVHIDLPWVRVLAPSHRSATRRTSSGTRIAI